MPNTGTSFDWNIIVNAIIALVAIVSLALSSKFNRDTLKQTKDSNEKMYRIQTYSDKFNCLFSCTQFFNKILNDIEPSDEVTEQFHSNFCKLVPLFENKDGVQKALNACNKYIDYYSNNIPLPDYTVQFKRELIKNNFKEDDVLKAFCFYARTKLTELTDDLFIYQ